MLQALWTMEILEPSHRTAAGVLIFHLRRVFGDYYQEGRVFGGDRTAYYLGDYRIENWGLKAQFRVHCYAGREVSPFGDSGDDEVIFTGSLDPHVERDVLVLCAHRKRSPERPFSLRLTKRAALA